MPPFDASQYAGRGAVGLLVPGAGSTVSRERALASLVRGRVVSSLVGLDGNVVLLLARKPAETTIYVSLPAKGTHHNVVRYPIAIVGPRYKGLLTSDSTRSTASSRWPTSRRRLRPSCSRRSRGSGPAPTPTLRQRSHASTCG